MDISQKNSQAKEKLQSLLDKLNLINLPVPIQNPETYPNVMYPVGDGYTSFPVVNVSIPDLGILEVVEEVCSYKKHTYHRVDGQFYALKRPDRWGFTYYFPRPTLFFATKEEADIFRDIQEILDVVVKK